MNAATDFETVHTPALPSPLCEWLRGGEVRGEFFRTRLTWVEQYHGIRGLERVLASLHPPLATAIEAARSGWLYPFEWLVTLDRAIELRLGRGRRRFHQELGRFSAFLEFPDAYPAPSGQGVHDVFRGVAVQHRFQQDFGSVAYEQTHPTAGRLVHTEQVCFSPVVCANRLGYYEQIISMHGGSRPRVEESACVCLGSDSCVFEVRWA